jgi:hypothetical protein
MSPVLWFVRRQSHLVGRICAYDFKEQMWRWRFLEEKKLMEWACPPECGAGLRWNEGDFTQAELDQILDLSAKHLVRSHGYKDNAETREALRKAIKPVER